MDPAVGRPAEPDEAGAHRLWRAWQDRVGEVQDTQLSGEDYLALREFSGVDLRAIWFLTQRWQQYGNPEGTPR